MPNNDYEPALVFDKIQIGLASPDKIREWSRGEVKKPETINYRTLKPERDGLFCEKIFGPQKDWECHCGKYKRIRYKGVICDRCGVEVTKSKVRRERMGHIDLAAPVSHIWYFKGIPSRMGIILGMSPRILDKIIYFHSYVVLDPGNTSLVYKEVLDEKAYREAKAKFGEGSFKAEMGAEAVQKLLADIDLEKEAKELKEQFPGSSGQKRAKIIKKLEVVESFRTSHNRPEWMVTDVIPVIPPDLRPMVQLDGGRFATSDLNDLYRRVINRNNRLKRLMSLNTPEIIIRNEKRMLQEAVDALIDNGRRGKPITGAGNRPLKSLSDFLKGKQGRFRQNLLGKRVDYSGRSVIVVGPNLKIYQCGVPKEMAIELFKPFVMKKLKDRGTASNIKAAKRMVERLEPAVWDVLEEVIKEHPVMLNRAPTLHRLGIQAFEPILVEGRALKLHPLVCTAYNADFDGDQMAIHVPLSVEAQAECRFLLLSPNNLLKPSDGEPVAVPSQDMVLGIYYLTLKKDGKYLKAVTKKNAKGELLCDVIGADEEPVLNDGETLVEVSKPHLKYRYKDENEALLAYSNKEITLHEPILVRRTKVIDGKEYSANIEITAGRIIFNEIIPQDLGFVERNTPEDQLQYEVDFLTGKKQLATIINKCINKHPSTYTCVMLDNIKSLGYKYSTIGALTVSVSDIEIPKAKAEYLEWGDKEVGKITKMYQRGLMTDEERHLKVIKIWEEADAKITDALLAGLGKYNDIYMMAHSGARGSNRQIKQLAGMRGLMASPTGETIELPIKANFREGLTVQEYFISAHGARKGLSDTALRTADSGYLTRRLVDVSQDIIIREYDCYKGAVDRWMYSDETNEPFSKRIVGKRALKEIRNVYKIKDKATNKERDVDELILEEGEIITAEKAAEIEAKKIKRVFVNVDEPLGMWVSAFMDGEETLEPLVDRIRGRFSIREIRHPETGEVIVEADTLITPDKAEKVITAGIKEVYIRTILTCLSKKGICSKCYGANMASGRPVRIGEAVGIIAAQSIGEPGTQLTMRTFHTGGVSGNDLTQGLPRVEELFEARKPKGVAIISEFGGKVTLDLKSKKKVARVTAADGETKDYTIAYGLRLKVMDGDIIGDGDELTEGSIYPHDLFRIKGMGSVQDYILREVQRVYRQQGVDINDKHIEVIVHQMLRMVRVEENGDTNFLPGNYVDWIEFEDINAKMLEEGKEPAKGKRALLGITKASLATESFLSAASFQETTKILTEAATKGKIDPLIGLKENVLIGKLIPAGTGMKVYRDTELKIEEKELEEEDEYYFPE